MLVPSVLKSSKISVRHCLNFNGTGTGPNWRRAPDDKADDAARPALRSPGKVSGRLGWWWRGKRHKNALVQDPLALEAEEMALPYQHATAKI